MDTVTKDYISGYSDGYNKGMGKGIDIGVLASAAFLALVWAVEKIQHKLSKRSK